MKYANLATEFEKTYFKKNSTCTEKIDIINKIYSYVLDIDIYSNSDHIDNFFYYNSIKIQNLIISTRFKILVKYFFTDKKIDYLDALNKIIHEICASMHNQKYIKKTS